MSVSILLRLMPGSRTGGRLAGQAELVDTGEVATFRDVDEMVAVLQRASLAAPAESPAAATIAKRAVARSAAPLDRLADDPIPTAPDPEAGMTRWLQADALTVPLAELDARTFETAARHPAVPGHRLAPPRSSDRTGSHRRPPRST